MSIMDELRDAMSESWRSFDSLDYFGQNWVVGGILTVTLVSILASKVMLPLILLAIGTTFYLRRSRDSDSL
jgi:hypothetical protein